MIKNSLFLHVFNMSICFDIFVHIIFSEIRSKIDDDDFFYAACLSFFHWCHDTNMISIILAS